MGKIAQLLVTHCHEKGGGRPGGGGGDVVTIKPVTLTSPDKCQQHQHQSENRWPHH